ETISPTILIHSRTVVEKQGYVGIGILSYLEGDVIEVEIEENASFNLGDAVKIIIYSPAGIYVFNSTIIAKDIGVIIILNPPENQKKFDEKRSHPRLELFKAAQIHAITYPNLETPFFYQKPLDFFVNNISAGGLGFTYKNEAGLDLQPGTRMEVRMDLGFPFVGQIEILRTDKHVTELHIGSKYVDLSNTVMSSLRAFLLTRQVKAYFEKKKAQEKDVKKREFK
ncbi:MAG TPA: PilZ domain-containing protein, partial [Bacilli bacterium]